MKLYLSTLFLPSGLTKTDVGESTDIKSSFSIFEMAGRIRKIVFNVLSKIFFKNIAISTGPPQDADVLTVLDFQIPCFRPETPSLLANQEGRGRKQGRPR